MLSGFKITLFLVGLVLLAPPVLHSFEFPASKLAAIKQKYGDTAVKRMQALAQLMTKYAKAEETTKLIKVNDFFNQIPYQFDIKVWGKEDYWATRTEFVCVARGDCEDYSIAKFFTLIQMGVSGKKLFLSYVKSLKYNRAHMVLTYFPKPRSVPYVLDNYNPKILPATKRKDLVPVYSFNAESLYLAKQQGLGKAVPSGLNKNKKWVELLNKVKRGE